MVKFVDPTDFYSDENIEAIKGTAITTEKAIDVFLKLDRRDEALSYKKELFDYLDKYLIQCDEDFVKEMKSRVEEKLK